MNWLNPGTFRRIKLATLAVGGPNMSTRAIVQELQRQDNKLFSKLSPATVEGWIDRSGSVTRWSDKVLARAKHGNNPGHSNGGRKGVLVSKLHKVILADSHVSSGQVSRGHPCH